MIYQPTTWALLAALALFVAFLVVKSRIPLTGRDPARVEARKKLLGIKQRAREARDDPKARARAWREAASVALDELGRPNLAAAFARRADRADPEDVASLQVLAEAMRRGRRYRGLEKLLWRRLAEDHASGVRAERAFELLLQLYDGPMRRPHQATVLRTLRERAQADEG